MQDHDNLAGLGRRERKRRQTRLAIATAAVDLAHERGFDAVTVEDICDRADVSRTTFFNYYPARDDAILGTALGVAPDEIVDAAFASADRDLVAGVLALAVPTLRTGPSGSTLGPRRTEIITSSPKALRRYSVGLVRAQKALVTMASGWLARNPDHSRLGGQYERESTLAVMIAYASMYAATEGWLQPITAATDDQIFVRGPRRVREILAIDSSVDGPELNAFLPVAEQEGEIPGRRERKRRATESTIQREAVQIASEVGFDSVTVEAICEAADVSRSTFFNYFPSRDAAILGLPLSVVDDQAVSSAIETAGGDLVFAALGVILSSVGPVPVDAELAAGRARLAQTQSKVFDASMIMLVDVGAELMNSLARGLRAVRGDGASTDEAASDAAFAANAAYAILAVIDGGWLSVVADPRAHEQPVRCARRDLNIVAG